MYRINKIATYLLCTQDIAEMVHDRMSHMDNSGMGQDEWEFWVNHFSKYLVLRKN
jgi:hypothetical protein